MIPGQIFLHIASILRKILLYEDVFMFICTYVMNV